VAGAEAPSTPAQVIRPVWSLPVGEYLPSIRTGKGSLSRIDSRQRGQVYNLTALPRSTRSGKSTWVRNPYAERRKQLLLRSRNRSGARPKLHLGQAPLPGIARTGSSRGALTPLDLRVGGGLGEAPVPILTEILSRSGYRGPQVRYNRRNFREVSSVYPVEDWVDRTASSSLVVRRISRTRPSYLSGPNGETHVFSTRGCPLRSSGVSPEELGKMQMHLPLLPTAQVSRARIRKGRQRREHRALCVALSRGETRWSPHDRVGTARLKAIGDLPLATFPTPFPCRNRFYWETHRIGWYRPRGVNDWHPVVKCSYEHFTLLRKFLPQQPPVPRGRDPRHILSKVLVHSGIIALMDPNISKDVRRSAVAGSSRPLPLGRVVSSPQTVFPRGQKTSWKDSRTSVLKPVEGTGS